MEDGAREAKLLEVLKLLKARLACNLLGYRLCQYSVLQLVFGSNTDG